MEFTHIPVLLHESIDSLHIRPDGVYCDLTCGGAGHSLEIAKRLTTGRLIGFDRDPDAVRTASERLAGYPAEVVRANYSEVTAVLERLGIQAIDGALMDLGVSSYQLDEPDRGFSYQHDAPLDMRMSREGMSAADVVAGYTAAELSRILFEYAEEKYARSIAAAIVRERERAPILTTGQLADIVRRSVPPKARREKNPAKKTFQAIRIAVNAEFQHLSEGLDAAFEALAPGGRLVVITFHSLEDRIVKRRFLEWCRGCECPPEFPVCICGKTPRAKLPHRKPVEPDSTEQTTNKRSRSAKLRVVEKLAII